MSKTVLFILLFSNTVFAESITVPFAFVPNSPAKASEVNLNFGRLYDEANRKEVRLSSLEANPNTLWNYSLVASTSSNNLSIEIKAQNGFDLSKNDRASIGFRSANLTSGLFDIAQLSSRKQIIIPNGATLGHIKNQALPIYIYALNTAGKIDLAVSKSLFSEENLYDSLSLDGNSDDGRALYSSIAHSQVPLRLLGRIISFQTNAGTWSFTPEQVTLAAYLKKNTGSPGWVDAPLTNNWKDYSPNYSKAKFFKSSEGIVRLQGMIKDGVCNSPFFTLPESYRPARRKIFMAFSGSNYTITRIDILPDGRIKTIIGCNNSWVNLENISFAVGH